MRSGTKRTLSFLLKKRIIIPALFLAILLTAVVGTMAWLRFVRSLQTATQVVITELSLKGPNENTIPIDLDGIDVSKDGSASYVFGVRSNNVEKYWIQLGYTTNLELTYTVYQATKKAASDSSPAPEGSVLIGDSRFIRSNMLNDDRLIRLKKETQTSATYGDYKNVQKNADPLYWQYGPVSIKKHETQYFILNISWKAQPDKAKETDMIYLTVGTGGLGSSEGTGEEANNS